MTVRVVGAKGPVEVHATARDLRGTVYRSSVVTSGGVMRLFSALAPADGSSYEFDAGERTSVTLTATVRGRRVSTNAVREIGDPRTAIRKLSVARDGVYGELFTPRAATRRPVGVLVFGGSEGGLYTLWDAKFLAEHGFTTLAIGYFHGPGLPANLHDVPLEYFARALRILGRQPGVDPGRLAVYGISYGGQAAQLLGIHYPQLVHAVVALVTANGSWCGIPPYRGQLLPCLGAAWTFHGKAIPFGRALIATGKIAFADERINGPIFLACGGEDIFSSCSTEQPIVDRLRARHFSHRVVFLDYPNVGHAIGSLEPYFPAYIPKYDGLVPGAAQAARADAWPKLLRFLAAV